MINLYYILLLTCNLLIFSKADISDLRKCADPLCKVKISEGRTTQLYLTKHKDVLGSKADEKVAIYSKEAGTNPELWGVEINGIRGYFPSKFIKEEKVQEKLLNHIVSTRSSNSESNINNLVEETKNVDESLSPGEKEADREDMALNPVPLNLEDAEFESINNFVAKEPPPLVIPSEEVKEDANEEMKITITKSSAKNIIQGEGQSTEEDKYKAGGQNVEVPNTEENVQIVNLPQEKIEIDNIEEKKINLEVKKDDSKNEEIDNDEGNGNEGEDNGSEYIIEDSTHQGDDFTNVKKSEDDLTTSEETPNNIEQNEVKEVNNAEIFSQESIGKSVKISGDNSASLEHSKATPGLDEKVSESHVNEAPQSKLELVQPTPPQYEMVDGTALPVEDSDYYQSLPSPEDTNTPTLESSSPLNYSPTTEKMISKTKLSGGPLTEPPLLLKNKFNGVKNLDSQINLKLAHENPLDVVENTEKSDIKEIKVEENTSTEKETSNSMSDENQILNNIESKERISIKKTGEVIQSTQGEEYSEFSSPKPDTIIGSQSQIQNGEINNNHIESMDSGKEIESEIEKFEESTKNQDDMEVTDSSESPFKVAEGPEDILVVTEDHENSESLSDQVESTESPESPVMKFIDIPESSSEGADKSAESLPAEGEGIIASIKNTFSFFKGSTDEDNNKPDQGKQQQSTNEDKEGVDSPQGSEAEDKGVNQKESEDIIEDKEAIKQEGENTAENKKEEITEPKAVDEDQNSSSLSVEDLPFLDPDLQPLEDKDQCSENFVKEEVESLPSEVEDHIHTDEEEGNIQSFKKKLLHASESVYHWFGHFWKMNEGMILALEGELADPHLSTGTVIFLLVVAGTIVILYLSHMIMVKMSRESPLLEMMNKLDRSQRVLKEENNNLKQRLTETNGQIKSAKYVDPIALQKLKQQFESDQEKFVEELEDLQERNQQLEADLEASTANEVELHRMLDELLSNQRETTNFEESVNSLQSMLDGQREIVEGLTSDLALKTRLNEELRNELKENKSKMSKLEYQIEQLTQSLEEVNNTKHDLMKKFDEEERNALALKDMNDTLRQEVAKVSKDSQNYYKEAQKLLQEVRKLKQKVQNKEAECQISKECLKKLQILTDGGGNDIHGKLAEVFKIVEVKTQLVSMQNERDYLQTKTEENEKLISSHTEDLKNIRNENACLRESSKELQKERDDAVSKLEVLSKYYEEREAQLRKTLESQEGLLISAEGSANVVSNRINTYELELESCRSQVESLKIELEEQKQSYKVQLANEEKKLHETWLTARGAERRQEELRQENTQLRQALTHIQRDSELKNMFNKSTPKRVDANGSLPSPIPMENDVANMHPPGLPPLDLDGALPHLPPPPMMFPGRPPLPPPPPGLPPLHPHMFGPLPHPPSMPDRRLPPAGRIASPPGYDRRNYSPESDRSRYSDHRYSPGPPPRFSPTNHRGHSPDRRSDHMRRNVNMRRNQRSPSPSLRRNQRSPSPLDPRQRHSPREPWYNHTPPQGLSKNHRSPPLDYYDSMHDTSRTSSSGKGKKTSTPLGAPNNR